MQDFFFVFLLRKVSLKATPRKSIELGGLVILMAHAGHSSLTHGFEKQACSPLPIKNSNVMGAESEKQNKQEKSEVEGEPPAIDAGRVDTPLLSGDTFSSHVHGAIKP